MAYKILAEKANRSGIPVGALKEVQDRGVGAWKTNPASVRTLSGEKNQIPTHVGKMGKEQWAQARVNAFINKKPSVYFGADDYIRRKYHLH